ncbi:hypothetical protein BV898_18370 [Hypsibius exemplaris]|uniref:CUB domain-containing protein n=1 Tax=Hypsibius exemplaris TaxID=2072580 RepID=A0A9X6RNR4_HYPEX|nr:hypothetical protein BV898_18370 [Hypsibius exemplaris]
MMRLLVFTAVLALVGAQDGTIIFDAVEAFFESPNYPNNYDDNLDIRATIVRPAGSRLSFSAEAVGTESFDILTLLEGSEILGYFRGHEGPQEIHSNGNQVVRCHKNTCKQRKKTL